MNKQPNPLTGHSEANGKSPYPLLQSAGSSQAEEEKWDLGWLAAVFRRQALVMVQVTVGTVLVASGLLFFVVKSSAPQYVGKFQLLVEPITADEQLARSSTRAQGAEVPDAQRINIDQSSLDYESQIRILQGPKLLEPVIKQVQERYPNVTYETLIKNLKIARITTLTLDKREQGTKLIEVTYQDKNSEKIKFVLESLSQTYLNYSLKERQSTIRRGIQFIDSQLSPLQQQVDFLQKQIQALRQNSVIVDPEQQGKQLTETAGKLEQARAENQIQLAEAQAKRNALAQQLQNSNLQPILGESTYYQTLLTQYQQIEAQIAAESARLKPDNPAMQALLEKRDNLRNLLRQEARRVLEKATDSISVAEARRQAIDRSQAELDQKIQQLPLIARKYTDLQRELALATDSLNKFSTRRQALQIDAAQQEIPWELTIPPTLQLDASGKPAPVGGVDKVRLLALIVVLAILLGMGTGFLRETMQDVIYTADEAKRATRLPLLGVIPHWEPTSAPLTRLPGFLLPIVAVVRPGAQPARPQLSGTAALAQGKLPLLAISATEAFRSLGKNLRLVSKSQAPIRLLTIASAEPEDGKSTIALHTATTAAAMGQRVLLVDADLRHPQIHTLLGLSNQQGLSNLLLGNQEFQNVSQPHPSCENLTVLTAGQSPLDPVELFTTNQVEPLFQQFQSLFDLVVVDTPPLVGLADSGLVAAQCDSLALVIRLGKTSRASVMAALEELKFLSTTVVGVIVNDAPEATVPGYYYAARN